MPSPAITVLCVVLLCASTPVAALEPPAPTGVAGSVGASSAHLAVEEVGGLDAISVRAGTRATSLNATPGTPSTCVSAERSLTRTESSNGNDVDVKEVRREAGCADDIDYTFDRTTWHATATGTIPTTVSTSVYERVNDGWQVVEHNQQTTATATIDLTWRGTGEERLSPWVYSPSICYTNPPSVCYLGGGAAVDRDAVVDGSVGLSGLSTTAELSDQPGTMRWWASAGPSRLP